MSLQQLRHTKLRLAGEARNWDLAAYEVDELGEGFDDVVAMHPTHKDSPVAPKDAIPRMVIEPLAEVRAAIEKRDPVAFAQAYDTLTAGCNNCHKATNFGFNRVPAARIQPVSESGLRARREVGPHPGGDGYFAGFSSSSRRSWK